MYYRANTTPQSPQDNFFDYAYSDDDGIKESFIVFSSKAHELEEQLGQFAKGCLALRRIAGLLLVIKKSREVLKHTREVFFRNATALVPDLFEQACEDSERFYIPPQYFKGYLPSFDSLPTILEELAASFRLLQVRIDEFREFTDEGLLLKSLLLTLERDLMYRASCARFYSDRLNTSQIQRYIHQFTHELQVSFEEVAAAVGEFTAVGVSAISREQAQSSLSLANILTVSTFFSGVTATTLQMSISISDQHNAILFANLLWFMSMIFSAGAALNSLLAMAWNATRSGSRGITPPFWVTMWIGGSQLVFLGIAIATFSAGLIVFTFASTQAPYTPFLAVAATAVTFIGLVTILLWMLYERSVSKQPARVFKSSSDSVRSESSKMSSIPRGITGAITHTLTFLRFQPKDDPPQDDVEKAEVKYNESEESPTVEYNHPDQLKMKLQGGVKSVGIINSALGAFSAAGRTKKQRGHYDRQQRPKPNLQIDSSSATVPPTELTLLDKPTAIIEFARYGTIRDIAYSDDGKRLAITCAKENVLLSWTGIFDAKALTTIMDIWHEGRVISEHLRWSPSGKKLIIKFERRFDVWHLEEEKLYPIQRHHSVQDIAWFSEDSFLIAEHNCVFKMNLTQQMAAYQFEHAYIRSIRLERKNNFLVLITRVAKSPEQFEPASGRSERRIVIYDMDKQEEIYQVPVLEDIYNIHLIADELDMLITHKDQKAFQLWSLDAGIRGSEITAKLKKRPVILPDGPGDYIGPTCIGGNYNQFILHVTKSGGIEVWRRESGMPYRRFESPVLKEEGVHCLSWRRSNDETATFATAGIDSDTLLVWQGEELLLSKMPAASHEPLNLLSPTSAVSGKSRIRWQRAGYMAAASSSVSLSPHEIDQTK